MTTRTLADIDSSFQRLAHKPWPEIEIENEIRKIIKHYSFVISEHVVENGYFTCLCGKYWLSEGSFLKCMNQHGKRLSCLLCNGRFENGYDYFQHPCCKDGELSRHFTRADLLEGVHWRFVEIDERISELWAAAAQFAEEQEEPQSGTCSEKHNHDGKGDDGSSAMMLKMSSNSNIPIVHSQSTPRVQEQTSLIELPEAKTLVRWSGILEAETPTSSPQETDVSKCTTHSKFDKASKAAYDKLSRVAPYHSLAYQNFVDKIGSHTELIERGFASFTRYLHHETISSLEDVYSFLHVAFAVSQTEVATPVRSSPKQFRQDIHILRNCLSEIEVTLENDGQAYLYKERDVFDEIVDVMHEEIDYAIAWLSKTTRGEFMEKMLSKVERLQEARNMLATGASSDSSESDSKRTCQVASKDLVNVMCLNRSNDCMSLCPSNLAARLAGMSNNAERTRTFSRTPPDRPKWLDVVTGSIFMMVAAFLQAVKNRDESFPYSIDIEAPYSFLCEPDPNLDPNKCTLLEEAAAVYMAGQREAFVRIVEDQIVRALPAISTALTKLVDTALFLLRQATLERLRHLENYILGFGKLFYASLGQRVEFVGSFLEKSWNCSQYIGDTMPYRVSCNYGAEKPSEINYRYDTPYTLALLQPSSDFPDGADNEAGNQLTIDCEFGPFPAPSKALKPESFADSSADEDSVSLYTAITSTTRETTPASFFNSDRSAFTSRHTSLEPSDKMDIDDDPTLTGLYLCNLGGCEARAFSTNPNLLRHQRDCHPELGKRKAFTCKVCGAISPRRGNMERHMQKVHGIVKMKAKKLVGRKKSTITHTALIVVA